MGTVFFEVKTDDYHIAFKKCEKENELAPEELTEKEQLRLSKINATTRKSEWLTTRGILRNYLHISNEIDYLPSGKPFLKNSRRQIAITHSKGIAGIMIANAGKIAIDCELIHEKPYKLLRRFASQTEIDAINPDFRFEQATILWCAKECVYKLYSDINFNFVHDIICKIKPESGTVNCSVFTGDQKDLLILKYELHNSYCFIWAAAPFKR